MRASVYGPGDGRFFTARGSDMLFKATADATEGRFSFMERELPPGGRRPPRHVHVAADEGFYLLDGEITFSLDDETVVGRRHRVHQPAVRPGRRVQLRGQPRQRGHRGEPSTE